MTPEGDGSPGIFATTRWSVVRAAGAESSTAAEAALESLCRTYWPPIYAFVRRFGHGPDDARDLTQEFFLRLLERNYPGQADPRKGRFRSFLLIALNHFLLDQRDRQRAAKRGSGRELISFDAASEEERLALEPVDELTPEMLFQRGWARVVLDDAEQRLRDEYASGPKAALWEILKSFLPGEQGALSCADAAARLGVAENTAKSHIRRLRERHRELVRMVVAETVATPAEVDTELRHLIAVIAG